MNKYLLLIAAAISLLFISCNPDGPGIFYKISIEQKLSDSDLAERSVYKVVELGDDFYVLSGGVVFKKSGSDWKSLSTPEDMLQAVSLEVINSNLYCVYAHKDNDNSTLYSGTGSSWTKSTSFENSENSLTVVASSENLFIVERIEDHKYRIHNLAQSEYIDVKNFVIGAAYDGSSYDYILSSPVINEYSTPEIVRYDGSSFSTLSVTAGDLATAINDQTALGGIYADGATIYISTKTGFVMKGTVMSTGISNINGDALDNKKLGPMDIVSINGSNYLLIGSNGGYYEMLMPSGTITTPTSSTTGGTDYISVDLYKEIVFSIREDESVGSDGFFIGTSNGLWNSSTKSDLDLK